MQREVFRAGIVQGDKSVIYPILEWLFRKMPELKERAYLARYLVRIDIPQDFMVDTQLAELFEQVSVTLETNFVGIRLSGFRTLHSSLLKKGPCNNSKAISRPDAECKM